MFKYKYFFWILSILFWGWGCMAPLAIANQTGGDTLTPEERLWLSEHDGKIRMAPCPDWEPMESFEKNGVYKGLVADYMKLLEKKLDFKFKLVRAESWIQIQDMARNRELDVISAAKPNPERWSYMNWTEPYFKSRNTLVAHQSYKGNLDISEIMASGMVIGVPEGYFTYDHFKLKYPDANIIIVKTCLSGLMDVSFGAIDALIVEIPHALHYIDKHNLSNLKLAGFSDFYTDFNIGIRNDWPMLYRIMVKGLMMISEDERKEINDRWVKLDLPQFYQNSVFWYIVGTLIMVSVVILACNTSLKKQVGKRTQEIRLNELHLEALLKLFQIEHLPIEDIIEFACKKVVRLTESQFGYLAISGEKDFLFSKEIFQECFSGKNAIFHASKNFPLETMGLWGDAIKKRHPVIANNYSTTNPVGKGIPDKFPSIDRYINIPIFEDGNIVAVAGVGGKKTDYNKSDLRQLTLLMEGLWKLAQRKNNQKIILKSEKLFRDLVENSLAGLSIIQEGQVLYSNPEQKRLSSGFLSPLETDEYTHIPIDCRDEARQFFQAVKSGNGNLPALDFRFHIDGEGADGRVGLKWVNCRACDIEYQGNKAVLLNTMDVTLARDMEMRLVAQEKMASLGHVCAGIAHEIRNPLSGINIHLRNLEKIYAGTSDHSEKIKACFGLLHSDTTRIESVIRRTLDFAKPTNCVFSIIDISLSILAAIQLTSVTLRKKQITIENCLKGELPLCIAEPRLIEDVVYNLIINASEALKSVKKEKKVKVSSRVESRMVVIIVDDSGMGVKPNLAEKIFEPFFTTKDYGTGIGLSICRRIIQDHGGTIGVQVNHWNGARFTIKLPVWEKTGRKP